MATLKDISDALTADEAEAQKSLGLLQQLISLVQTLSADLQAALGANDPAAIQAIVTRLNADQQNLVAAEQSISAALAANQAAAPTGTAPTGTVASTGTVGTP